MGINFSKVNFKYNRGSNIQELKDINLSIKSEGEFVTLLGHTGSGKSTLVQLMNGLLLPYSGKVVVFEHTLIPRFNGKLKKLRQKVGLVFQFPEYQLFEENVIKDVMFGPKNFGQDKEEAKKNAEKACELIGIDPELYDRPPFNLSGGQMRKVAIAGIIASDPQVLVLDEPTVGLDPKTKEELLNILKDFQRNTNKTIIMITHDMDIVAKYADRVIALKNQTIAFDGNKHDLFNDLPLVKELDLSLPGTGKVALALKEKGLISFERIPITETELLKIIASNEVPNG